MSQTASRLTPGGAMALARAENRVAKAKALLELAQEDREKVRERYRELLPDREEIKVGTWRLKRTVVEGSDYFSLADYVAAGHRISAVMREFMRRKAGHERWTVKDTKGPAAPGAVEPPS